MRDGAYYWIRLLPRNPRLHPAADPDGLWQPARYDQNGEGKPFQVCGEDQWFAPYEVGPEIEPPKAPALSPSQPGAKPEG